MYRPFPIIAADVVFLFVIILNLPDLITRRKASRTWKKIEGKLIEKDFRAYRQAISIFYKYTYRFEKKEYTGKDRSPNFFLHSPKAGEHVPLLVNPKDPKKSFVCTADYKTDSPWLMLLFLYATIALAVLTVDHFFRFR